ncbi:hypothetical protein [Spongiactinospora sp. TRM90649]|uniref:hypothetical protein n=1 Tax=Spongiactinospora sp. TRM90649 TaxID=3031114 RepID=UPI0023F8FF9F|nr:hypothetical protein [Spongiactinospora sp. TRM90649]MDF5757246.1 hypothetical protein [Spongiactinospora sp. TRM90649]
MSTHRGEIAGYRPAGRGRPGDVGTWREAVAPDGRQVSVLRFDTGLVAAGWARQRLVTVVTSDQRLVAGGLGGLMPLLDLVAADDEVWLIAGHPAVPTLTDLLETTGGQGAGPDAAGAAAVLVESAQTLLAVHAAGLAHGALQPGTLVIGEDGATLLAERGLADALRGRSPAPDRDVTAWASLARGLAAAWAGRATPGAALLEQAAATATTLGLAAARDALLNGRENLPGGYVGRDRLVEAVRRWRRDQVPAAVTGPPYAGADDVGRDEGEIVTLLHVPTPIPTPIPTPAPAPTTGPATAGTADSAAQRADTAGRGDVRFGPGVPARNTAEQIWQSGQQTVHADDRRSPQRVAANKRRRKAALSAAVTALVIVAAVLAWLQLSGGPALAVEGVDVKAPKKTQGCDTTVTINGVITTNGADGLVRYQWRRSDQDKPIEQTETVRSGTSSYPVSLKWTVKGEGSFKGTATLRVLSPVTTGKRGEDKATFTYRCR